MIDLRRCEGCNVVVADLNHRVGARVLVLVVVVVVVAVVIEVVAALAVLSHVGVKAATSSSQI